MGYVKHHAIVVTGWQENQVKEAHERAREIFRRHFQDSLYLSHTGDRVVSEIVTGLANSQTSFFIAPDGSKEGWDTSDNANDAREEFMDWLEGSSNYCNYIEIRFGGDDDAEEITRSKATDLNKEQDGI